MALAGLKADSDPRAAYTHAMTAAGQGVAGSMAELDRIEARRASRVSESPKSGAGRVALPDEYASHAMVFRTFDKVSYALVMSSVKPTAVGYELKHPDAPY